VSSKEEKTTDSVLKWAAEKKWDRPFNALLGLPGEIRDGYRDYLAFDWSSETSACENPELKAALESQEIIDCNIRGLAARLHTISEQISPFSYLSWRSALTRILDMLEIDHDPKWSVAEIEKRIVSSIKTTPKKSRPQTDLKHVTVLANAALKKTAFSGILTTEIASAVTDGWDSILGSEDKPAIKIIHSICETLHPIEP
jgi:hypothetical protein